MVFSVFSLRNNKKIKPFLEMNFTRNIVNRMTWCPSSVALFLALQDFMYFFKHMDPRYLLRALKMIFYTIAVCAFNVILFAFFVIAYPFVMIFLACSHVK